MLTKIFKLYDTCYTPFTAHTLQQPLRQTGQIPISQLMVILSGPAVPDQHNLNIIFSTQMLK